GGGSTVPAEQAVEGAIRTEAASPVEIQSAERPSESAGPSQGATTTPLDVPATQPAPPTPAQNAEAGPVDTPPAQPASAAPIPPAARGTGPLAAGPGSRQARGTGPLTAGARHATGPTQELRPVGILPWRGHFGWHGLLVIESREPVDLEDLDVAFRGHGQLTTRMSIALELERGISAPGSATDQSSRLVEFF